MRIYYKRYSDSYFGHLVTGLCRLPGIRHLHFPHNAPYLHPKILHSRPKRKLKTMRMQNFAAQIIIIIIMKFI